MSEQTYTLTEIAKMAREAGATDIRVSAIGTYMKRRLPGKGPRDRVEFEHVRAYLAAAVFRAMLAERKQHVEAMAKLRQGWEKYGDKPEGDPKNPQWDAYFAALESLFPDPEEAKLLSVEMMLEHLRDDAA